MRGAISANFGEFRRIVERGDFTGEFGSMEGEALKQMPGGFDAGDPAAKYLKLKSFTAWKTIPDEVVLSEKFLSSVVRIFRVLKPLNEFLNDATSRLS